MSNIFRWESDWQMEFHPSKCQLLRVTKKPRPSPTIYDIHEHKLEIVESDQCLRVTIHTTINWNTHIESITKKATRPGSLFKETCNTVHKEQGCMLHSAIEIIAWVRIYNLGPTYLRQHPAIRKRTKTISQVCNERLSIK